MPESARARLVYKGRTEDSCITGPNKRWTHSPSFPLQHGVAYTFGRGRDADIHFFSNTIARLHMQVVWSTLSHNHEHRLLILDLQSTNGISYQQERKKTLSLVTGECFQVAESFEFEFVVEE